MLKLLTIMLLAGTGVTLDGPKDKKPIAVVEDAGVEINTAQIVATRRSEFTAKIQLAMNSVGKDSTTSVRVRSILWSTSAVSTTTDGAIVILDAAGVEIGLFFYFRNGEWQAIKDDFK